MYDSFIVAKFRQHPGEVGETYWQHFGQSCGFALFLLLAFFTCLIHAVLPFLFKSTGSTTIAKLHLRMVRDRKKRSTQPLRPRVDDGKFQRIGRQSIDSN